MQNQPRMYWYSSFVKLIVKYIYGVTSTIINTLQALLAAIVLLCMYKNIKTMQLFGVIGFEK